MAEDTFSRPRALCLMGPTASGKTAVAIELAEQHPVEIVSVDSALVYKGLDIGSGKPDPDTLARIPHHLVDIRDPADPYSAADFRRDALECISDILGRGKTPVLTGGTMLYFKVLRDGLAEMPEADESVRAGISALAREKGWPAVHARLAEVDPETAQRLKPADSQRLQRALEVYEVSGITMSELHRREQGRPDDLPAELVFIAMYPEERSTLHGRIARRFHEMLDQGLVDEVRRLYERKDLNNHLPAIRSVGYRQVWDYLDGQYDYDIMTEKAIAATRQLAKRQYTWLRRWPDLHVLNSEKTSISSSCWQILHEKQ